jgi:phage replication-related protein YjqB (UPF0714/DUF867 family)
MPDTYRTLEELARHERADDFRVLLVDRLSPVTIVAPHGGRIEPGTSQVAETIAGPNWNLFAFEGLKPRGNSILHVTSTRFRHPELERLLARSAVGVSVHGMAEPGLKIEVGGLNARLAELVGGELALARFDVSDGPSNRSARNPENFINRVVGGGIQLEISQELRTLLREDHVLLSRCGEAVRSAIARYLECGDAD